MTITSLEFTCGQSDALSGRIARGENATEGNWPWIASLQIKGNHFCGGTLISPSWVGIILEIKMP